MSVMDISKTDKAALMAEAELNAVEAEFTERTPEIVAAEIRQIAERTPEIVAAEIRQIKDQTRKLVLNNSIEIGKRLCEAKEMVPHGEWGTWLEQNVDYKQSTANKLMKIYEQYGAAQGELWGASAKSETFTNLTYSKALALLAVPEEEREEFVKENHVEDMSTRELQEAIKARDEAVKERDKAREELDEAIKSREKVIDSYIREEENKRTKLQKDIELAEKKLKMEKERHDALMESAEKNKEDQLAEIERLKAELAKAEERPDVTVSDAAEIARLKEQLAKAEKLGAERMAGDEETARFKILYQTVQNNFSDLMDAMACIRDEAAKAKREAAVRALLKRFTEVLDEES